MPANWREFLTVRGVVIPPRSLRRTSTEADIASVERRFKLRLPDSYRRFALEIGAGTLGEVDFICPGPVRTSGIRKRDRLAEHIRLTRAATSSLGVGLASAEVVGFGSTADGDWFFWLASEIGGDDAPIYVASSILGDGEDGVQVCAEGLPEFIDQVCLGGRLVDLGLCEPAGESALREFLPVRERA